MWIDPPVFVEDGLPLQARQLNILSDNAAWLYNQVRRMVPAMPVYRVPWVVDYQYDEQVQAQYRIRHVGRYLRARIYGVTEVAVTSGTPPNERPGWKLYYNGNLIVNDLWPDNTPSPWIKDYEIDLQAVLPGLEIGIRYQVYAEVIESLLGGYTGFFELAYIYEAEMADV